MPALDGSEASGLLCGLRGGRLPQMSSFATSADPSPADRAAQGKAARGAVPRSSHGDWAPAGRDPLRILAEQDEGRVPELVPIRYGRMLASPFAFFRGGGGGDGRRPGADADDRARRVQLCGDAHLSNFGVFAAPERRLVFDFNDFDETLPGPVRVGREAARRQRRHRRPASAASASGSARRRRRAPRPRYRESMRRLRRRCGNLDVWYSRIDVESRLAGAPLARSTARGFAQIDAASPRPSRKDSMRALREADPRSRRPSCGSSATRR